MEEAVKSFSEVNKELDKVEAKVEHQEAVKSFSEINKTLDKVEGEELTVAAGTGFVVRLVEDGIPYEKLFELLKQELEKDPKKVAHDLLELVKPASCLQLALSCLGRK
jgi:tetrahydromethanopterin S-methyltransferase subunit G